MAFYVMTIVCTVAWDAFVDEKLYNSTDDVPFTYLIPGHWVGDNNWPIKVVPQIVPDDNMNGPDTIKEGWTVGWLWALWFLFFATSVIISSALARVPWPRIELLGAKRNSAQ
jgi:hypothetical protein